MQISVHLTGKKRPRTQKQIVLPRFHGCHQCDSLFTAVIITSVFPLLFFEYKCTMFSFLIKFFNPYDFIPTFIHIKTELRSTCVGVTNRQTLVSGNVSSTICNAVLPTPFPRYSGEMKNSSISPLTLFVAFTTAQPTMLFSARTDSSVMSFSLNSAVNSFFSFSSSEKCGKMPFSKYFA